MEATKSRLQGSQLLLLSPAAFRANGSRAIGEKAQLVKLPTCRRGMDGSAGQCGGEPSEIFMMVDVEPLPDKRNAQAAGAQLLSSFFAGRGRAPRNACERTQRAGSHSEQVKPPIGCRSQHRVCGEQSAACLAQQTNGQARRVASQSECHARLSQCAPQGSLQPLAQIPVALQPHFVRDKPGNLDQLFEHQHGPNPGNPAQEGPRVAQQRLSQCARGRRPDRCRESRLRSSRQRRLREYARGYTIDHCQRHTAK